MVEVIWTEQAVADLHGIADFIALEDPTAAAAVVGRMLEHATQLAEHPHRRCLPTALVESRHRHIVEPSCRMF